MYEYQVRYGWEINRDWDDLESEILPLNKTPMSLQDVLTIFGKMLEVLSLVIEIRFREVGNDSFTIMGKNLQ